jgi:hypothetical protein
MIASVKEVAEREDRVAQGGELCEEWLHRSWGGNGEVVGAERIGEDGVGSTQLPVLSPGQENSQNFQTQQQTRGPTHTPQV